MEELKNAIREISNSKPYKIVISNRKNKDVEYKKININLKEAKGREFYQVEKFTEKQVFHENIEIANLEAKIFEFMEEDFKQLDAWSEDENFNIKISKKGKVFFGKKAETTRLKLNGQNHTTKKKNT